LEFQSRYGAKIGEVFNIRVKDINGRKIIIQNPKSGKEKEAILWLSRSPAGLGLISRRRD
jgi:hypothetical protein